MRLMRNYMVDHSSPITLGTEKIGKLLRQYSLPAIIGMTITSLYNIIDSIFIGHGVGAMAISGLAVTFPLMNLIMAFGTLVSAGGSALSSIRLGQKDKRGATELLAHTTLLGVINSLLFGSFSLIFLDKILVFFGASHQTLPYAHDFMQIILLGAPVSYTMIGLNNIMRATGYPRKAMLTSLVSVVANIVLAPVFIFYLGWGIRGAATATVISQFIAMVWVVSHFCRSGSYIHFTRDTWRLRWKVTKSIFAIGMAPFLMNACACIIVIVVNKSLESNGGDLAIGAYGIMNRIATLFTMIVLGLTMGMQPLIGYNYGAKNYSRVKKTLKLGIISGMVITTAGFLVCELFPHAIVKMFTTEKELTDIATSGLRIVMAMLPFVGVQIVISSYFQSIGQAKVSIFLSLSRQLFYLLPCLLLFPRYLAINGVWISMPVSDFLAIITAVIVLWVHFKNKKQP